MRRREQNAERENETDAGMEWRFTAGRPLSVGWTEFDYMVLGGYLLLSLSKA